MFITGQTYTAGPKSTSAPPHSLSDFERTVQCELINVSVKNCEAILVKNDGPKTKDKYSIQAL